MVIALLTILLTTGCASFSKLEQPVISHDYSLNSTVSLGQSILARYDGLQNISIFMQPEVNGEGSIHLALYPSPDQSTLLAEASIPSSEITSPSYYTFAFPPLPHSNLKDFYFSLTYVGDGSVLVGLAPGSVYLNGSIYLNNTPQDAQFAFSTGHQTAYAALGLLKEGLYWLLWITAAIFLFIIPGWALLSAFYHNWESLYWTTKLGLATAASLPVYPVLMLWTNLFGIRLGALYAFIPPVLGVVFLFWKSRPFKNKLRNPFSDWKHGFSKLLQLNAETWADLTFILVLGIIIFIRFWAVRNLEIPMWGDSYQHSVIAQLLVDNHGLFTSWQSYADNVTFSYHFGFHSLVAVFHWLTKLPIPLSTLWTGQILNVLAVLALLPLASLLGRTRWAGVAALLSAGVLYQIPNFYVNWGRYPQLAGQVILGGLVWLLYDWFEHKEKNYSAAVYLCLIFAGLAMTHYRIVIMAVLFMAAYGLLYLRKSNATILTLKTIMLSAGSFTLFLPWFSRAFSSDLVQWLQKKLSVQVQQSSENALSIQDIGLIGAYIPAVFWLALIFSIAWGLWKREKGIALISLWWLFIFVAANPQWLNLPSEDILDSFVILIAAYFPAAIIIGAAFGWIITSLETKVFGYKQYRLVSVSFLPLLLALVCIVGLYAGRARLFDIQVPAHTLVTRPDLRAFDWIQKNTPEHASFLVNSFFAYDNNLIVGSDAGWWLPLLANRRTSLPPLTYGIERGPTSDYRVWINQLPAEILAKGITHPDVLNLIRDRDFDFIYIGQQQGAVNSNGSFLDLGVLVADPHFEPVYHQDRVWIFSILELEEDKP